MGKFRPLQRGIFLTRYLLPLSAGLLAIVAIGCSHSQTAVQKRWSAGGAANYLDKREAQWSNWPGAARDHGTFCVSCHTALPYALARPALAKALSEPGPSVEEKTLLNNVVKRVRLWENIGPYYSDKDAGIYKTDESRGTEAILNALILASHDARQGQLGAATRMALDHMWKLQETTGKMQGSWPWLQFGHQEPWEADDSPYFGACLAAVAVGTAPAEYRASPNIQDQLKLLSEYLNSEYLQQSTMNHIALLWASTKLPGLLDPQQQKTIVDEVLKKQRADGGWLLSPLTWKWRGWTLASLGRIWLLSDGSLASRSSDGYATAIISFVLPQAGVPADNPQLQRALLWLARNQTEEGYWPSSSPNKRRSPSSNVGHFMSDAATAYAVLALTSAEPTNSVAIIKRDFRNSTKSQ
jgi:squalene-hopene/tetraprenyl-beta-curcumene cyclase